MSLKLGGQGSGRRKQEWVLSYRLGMVLPCPRTKTRLPHPKQKPRQKLSGASTAKQQRIDVTHLLSSPIQTILSALESHQINSATLFVAPFAGLVCADLTAGRELPWICFCKQIHTSPCPEDIIFSLCADYTARKTAVNNLLAPLTSNY